MPLTAIQKDVALLLAGNRSSESHIAGGAAINCEKSTLRYSADLDLFHDEQTAIARYAELDAHTLETAGFEIEWQLQTPQMYRAIVGRNDDRLRLDWVEDSAFRFFPVQPHEQFGFCLHRADLATNKVLALVGRTEIRDLLDVLELHDGYLSLGAMVWAACGKDPGFTPDFLLQLANRHVRHTKEDLRKEHLAREVSLVEIKRRWLEAQDQARELCESLPAEELGCLYLSSDGAPSTPDPRRADFPSLYRHYGQRFGSMPNMGTS